MKLMTATAIGTLAATIIATGAGIAPVDAAESQYAAYRSCTALRRDWPHGVAKSAAAAQQQVNDGNPRPASGPRARRVYRNHRANLDRDNDGTACEG